MLTSRMHTTRVHVPVYCGCGLARESVGGVGFEVGL